MRSKGSCFTLGVWGLRVCSLEVAFASGTDCNRPQPFAWGPYGRAYTECCKSGHCWKFQTSRNFVSVEGVALCDVSTCFKTCRDLSCVTGAILLLCFQKVSCGFRGRHNTLVTSMVILNGTRSTLDPSCCVFFGCESQCLGCVKW